MGVLSSLQVYAGNWNLVSSTALDAEDINAIRNAKVVNSQYGKSVCFFLKAGGQSYMPMSTMGTQLELGAEVDLSKVTIETLHRDGSGTIQRCRID